MEAQEWCRKYMKSGNVKDLTQAWDLYYHVFRRISKQLPQVGGEVQFCCVLQCKLSILILFHVFWLFKTFKLSTLEVSAYDLLQVWCLCSTCCKHLKYWWLNCCRSLGSMNSSDVSVRFNWNSGGLYFFWFWQLTSLELQYVSPKLLMCRDLELAVPGTYDPNQPIIRIQSIAPSLQVITSKQRPRKLTLMGKREQFSLSYSSI